MDTLALPRPPSVNLRAYRCAVDLATDLFWITRRFPQEEQHALTKQLRRAARAISLHVTQGWACRYDGAAFRSHVEEALDACTHLRGGLDSAGERGYLSDAQHRDLQARLAELYRMLGRLHDQRIALLA